MRTTITHYKATAQHGTSFAVMKQVKSYGSLGPDPGRLEHESVIVLDVSREYAEMLARELTKHEHSDRTIPLSHNPFCIVEAIERTIDMWTGENAEDWGERITNPIAY